MGWPGWEGFRAGVRSGKQERLSRGARMHAKPCVVDDEGNIYPKEQAEVFKIAGVFFHSLKEARRWTVLRQLAKAGRISDLRRQVRFHLNATAPDRTNHAVGVYTADFVYVEDGQTVVEDVKGQARREDLYCWKARHFHIQYGFKIREV